MKVANTIGVFTYGVAVPTDGGIRVNESLGRLVDGLAKKYGRVIAVFATPDETRLAHYAGGNGAVYNYELKGRNIQLETISLASSLRPSSLAISASQRLGRLFRLVSQCEFAYIFVPGVMGLSVAGFCRMLNKPFGVYFGADWLENARFRADWGRGGSIWRSAYEKFAKHAERFVTKNAAFVLVTGKAYIARLSAYNANIHETVLMSNFDRDDILVETSVRKNRQRKVILFVGPVTERKGVIYLIQALSLLPRYGISLEHIEVQLVGTKDELYWKKIVHAAESEGVLDILHYIGYVSDKNKLIGLYRGADILVVPSLAEGFPRVIYEAMSQRVPVIASNIPSVKETIGQSGAILFAEPEMPDDIARRLAEVLTNHSLRQSLIDRGSKVTDNFFFNDPAYQVEALISQIKI